MITLTDLRALRALLVRALTHAANPAIVRLTDRTVEGLARTYLPRWMPWGTEARETAAMIEWSGQVYGKATLALTDPGTAHALLVALALALGLDPGVGGLCGWRRAGGGLGWMLHAGSDVDYWFHAWQVEAGNRSAEHAPTVAAEPDPIKALALAVRHVLEHP